MNPQLIINDEAVVEQNIAKVRQSMAVTSEKLTHLLNTNPKDAFYEMKFGKIGQEPLEGTPLNLIEQLNQVYTYLVSLYGVKFLIKRYPEYAPFKLNLGTTGGYDIESIDGNIICECFSTTSLRSNDKVNKDAKRLMSNKKAEKRFIFYHTPGNQNVTYYEGKYDEIKFVKVELE